MNLMMAPLNVFYAFVDTLSFLWFHILICLIIPALLTWASYVKHEHDILESGTSRISSWLMEKYLSTLAFSFLGLLTAYFLSRGIDKMTGANSFASGVGAAIVPTISAGIAFFDGNANQQASTPSIKKPRSGIIAFLILTLISYQMFTFQKMVNY